jgi:hypothetical protein
VCAIFQAEDVESWYGCFVVVTEHKIRIRRPGSGRVEETASKYRTQRRAMTGQRRSRAGQPTG